MAVTITVNEDDTRGVVTLLVANSGPGAVAVTVRRSVFVAASDIVRGLDEVTIAESGTRAAVDGEAPIGVAFVYRAYDDTGALVATSSSVTLNPAASVDGKRSLGMLRHLTDTNLSIPVLIAGIDEVTRAAVSETFLPVGASLPIVSTMPRQGRQGTLRLASLSDEHTQAIVDLLADGTVVQLVVQPGTGVERNGMFIHVGDLVESRLNTEYEGEEARIFELPFIEVQAPSSTAPPAIAYTWGDVLDDFTTWQDLLDTGPATWGDLILTTGA